MDSQNTAPADVIETNPCLEVETPAILPGTNFINTAVINMIAGNMPNGGWPAIERQFKLIADELEELRVAIANRDIEEVRDGIGDVLFTTYGMGHRAAFNTDADYQEVLRSNMTKFDDNTDCVMKTQAKYEQLGVKVESFRVIDQQSGRAFYVTRSAEDQNVNGKDYPKGKWLKSYRFEEPQYAPLPAVVLAKLDETK